MLLGYTRVSTLDQAADNRTSLDEQERVIRGIAMVRGVDKMDVTIYSDPGISGAVPLRFRPEGLILRGHPQVGHGSRLVLLLRELLTSWRHAKP